MQSYFGLFSSCTHSVTSIHLNLTLTFSMTLSLLLRYWRLFGRSVHCSKLASYTETKFAATYRSCVIVQLVWTSYQCRTRLGVEFGQPWKIVSYLPLSHVAAEVSDIFSPIVVAATVYFAEPDALKVRFVLSLHVKIK